MHLPSSCRSGFAQPPKRLSEIIDHYSPILGICVTYVVCAIFLAQKTIVISDSVGYLKEWNRYALSCFVHKRLYYMPKFQSYKSSRKRNCSYSEPIGKSEFDEARFLGQKLTQSH